MPPSPLAKLVQGICAAIACSALAAGVMAVVQPRASWVMFGFEAVVLVSAVLGALLGRGKFRDGPSLGLLCVAGAIVVASAFGYLGGGRTLFGTDVRTLTLARAAAGAALVGVAAWLVLSRAPGATLPRFTKGAALSLGVIALLAGLWKGQRWIGSLNDVGQLAVGMVAFALITALLAASIHMLVRAFQAGLQAPARAA
jgi:hypothetical protein